MWSRPEKPDFKSADVAGFGETLGVILLFAGCMPNDVGICNSEVDYSIHKPDGSLLFERTKQRLWKDKAPPPQNTHLASAVLGFTTRPTLPVGKYLVKATVYDINAKVSFDLATHFELKK